MTDYRVTVKYTDGIQIGEAVDINIDHGSKETIHIPRKMNHNGEIVDDYSNTIRVQINEIVS